MSKKQKIMKSIDNNIQKNNQEITRKEAIKKIGNYGRYAALTALGTYMILNPQKAQAASVPADPGSGF
jgi:hypothetical protein